MSDRPIFVPTEDGLDDIDCASFPVCRSFDEFLQRLGELHAGEHDFGTLVVDTVDWLEKLIHADVCRRNDVENLAQIGYGKGPDFALTQWRLALDGFEMLRRDRGLAITLLGHARIEKFENPQTDSYHRYAPRLHIKASDLIQDWCNEVLFANYKVYTTSTDEGFNRKRVKGAGAGERVLYTTDRPAHVAKNRLNLPDEMPLDWCGYAQHLPGGERYNA